MQKLEENPEITQVNLMEEFDLSRKPIQKIIKDLREEGLVHRILSNCHIDLSDFSSAALSSVAVATATPPSSALHMKKSSCANIAET